MSTEPWAIHYNLLNQQHFMQFNPNSGEGPGVANPSWQLPASYQTPRYVQLGVSYDF